MHIIVLNRGFYGLSAFNLEQALQLALKAYLLKQGVDYPGTHSIRKLLELIYNVERDKNRRSGIKQLLSSFSVEIGDLEDAYITARYVVREYAREEVERLIKFVKEVLMVLGLYSEGSS